MITMLVLHVAKSAYFHQYTNQHAGPHITHTHNIQSTKNHEIVIINVFVALMLVRLVYGYLLTSAN